mmetsp:Transcript_8397/g.8248  ORF Transcript_8397/g.8248 Transcript_8397/m.8248 type:complete len:84 (-) Transcript_8397:106-357(-)
MCQYITGFLVRDRILTTIRKSYRTGLDHYRQMVSSSYQQHKTKWHLITSFNESGKGTLIESSTDELQSRSGMGYYLDALHHNY